MTTAREICEAIGREKIKSNLGVTPAQITNACAENAFPSNWAFAVERLCASANVDFPRHLFKKMRGAA